MAKVTRSTLKSYFETGDQPTESEFKDVFDSTLNLSESNAITGSLIISGSTGDTDDGSKVNLHVMGDITSSGNVIVYGNLTAEQYIVSSSITNIITQTLSGSTEFGNSADDTHKFTGNITSSGNITAVSASFLHITASTIDVDADTINIGGTPFNKLDVDNLKLGKPLTLSTAVEGFDSIIRPKAVMSQLNSNDYQKWTVEGRLGTVIGGALIHDIRNDIEGISSISLGKADATTRVSVTGSLEISGSSTLTNWGNFRNRFHQDKFAFEVSTNPFAAGGFKEGQTVPLNAYTGSVPHLHFMLSGSGQAGIGLLDPKHTLHVSRSSNTFQALFVDGPSTFTDHISASGEISASTMIASTFTGTLVGNANTTTSASFSTTTNNINPTEAFFGLNESNYVTFIDGASGAQGIEVDSSFRFNPHTNGLTVANISASGNITASTMSSVTFTGALVGNATTSTSASHALLADTALLANTATTATSASFATISNSSLTTTSASHAVVSDTALLASNATNVTATANNLTNESNFITFVDGASGAQGIETDTGLKYNPNSNGVTLGQISASGEISASTMIASTFTGALIGNATTSTSSSFATEAFRASSTTGNSVTATSASHAVISDTALLANTATTATSASHAVISDTALVAGLANVATSVTATANNLTNESNFITFVDGASGAQGIETDTGLKYNPNSNGITLGQISASGDISASGNITATSGFIGSSLTLNTNIASAANTDATFYTLNSKRGEIRSQLQTHISPSGSWTLELRNTEIQSNSLIIANIIGGEGSIITGSIMSVNTIGASSASFNFMNFGAQIVDDAKFTASFAVL